MSPGAIAEADLTASWDAGYVGLPASLTGQAPVLGNWRGETVQRALDRLDETTRVPAVIYLHGCTGFGGEGNAYRHFLLLQGFAFFAPDSLAQPGRTRNCDPQSRQTGLRGNAGMQRRAELHFALDRIAALPWIDQDRLYLIGFSEGAAAAAGYDGNRFAGVVLTAWHCHGPLGNRGLAAPLHVPVLAIVSSQDPWYPGLKDRTCATFTDKRPASRAILLSEPTHALLTSNDSEAARRSRQAILAFLTGKS